MTTSSDRTLSAANSAALADTRAASTIFDNADVWFSSKAAGFATPLAVESWVFDPTRSMVLLVKHRWRGWVPPGGTVEPGELPRTAAVREVFEETGLTVVLFERAAAAAVRSYRSDWSPTLGLSYATIADADAPLRDEEGQPARWTSLGETWETVFAADRERMLDFIRRGQ